MRKPSVYPESNVTIHISYLLILSGVFAFFVVRAWAMYPSVFPDEYVHSRAARLIPFESAEIPGYLFYLVYSLTGLFENNFLIAARVLNAAFFVAGSYIVYLTARKFMSPFAALVIGTISVLSPMNTYTTYFMPESMFYFLFWVMIYFLLNPNGDESGNKQMWLKVGLAFGALSLVKPHALFIYPAVLLYAFVVYGLRKATLVNLFLFTIAATLIKFGIGFLAAGMNGLTFFGSMYTDHARSVITDPNLILNAVRSIFTNILGNFFLVTTVLGLGFVHLFSFYARKKDSIDERHIWILIGSLFLMLVPMVSVFSTSVALYDLNLDNRLYLRYYNYIFPLVYILIGARLSQLVEMPTGLSKAILGSVFLVFTLVMPYYHTLNNFFYPFKVFLTDSPELHLLQYNPIALFVVAVLGIVVIGLWLYKEPIGIKSYLYVFMPIFILCTTINSIGAMSTRYDALAPDNLGAMYNALIPKSDHGEVVIAGNNRLVINHAAIYSSSGSTRLVINKIAHQLDFNLIPVSTKWLITVDSLEVPDSFIPRWRAEGMTIYQNAENK
jgi:phosphoglycerol transferase